MEEQLIELISKYDLEDFSERILAGTCYGILVSRDMSEPPGIRDSKLGGLPSLPDHFSYPTSEGRPLDFILQLNCEDLAGIDIAEPLPESGFLYFFYDSIEQPSGYRLSDRDGSLVTYVSKTETLQPYQHSVESVHQQFIESKLRFNKLLNIPSGSIFCNSRDIKILGRYNNLIEEWNKKYIKDKPYHQILGIPQELQQNLQEICDLASTGRKYPRARKGKYDKHYYVDKSFEWRLLFQIDSNFAHADLPNGFCWGDLGRLFVLIRESDLREYNFENAWTVMQC